MVMKRVTIRFNRMKQAVKMVVDSIGVTGVSAVVLRRSETSYSIVPYSSFAYMDVEEIEDGNG